ncbi:uncharacterized protein LOC117410478 isoform X3 [Acipenser ruthenus]|uniref:uncharacterized protein LOC117410478 isoform X3 n=1 Tax=Acipenser ruthenus TaxID=7906 RepID=UPI0027412CE6|nr:uncharacterized protein LOC117410478 isoform X3 [Acipenser ruthenus]
MTRGIFWGITLLMSTLASEVWSQLSPDPGLLYSECHNQVFWVALNATFLEHKTVDFAVHDKFGKRFMVTPKMSIQCGYTINFDYFGNVIFEASVLACQVDNENDERFSLTVEIIITEVTTASTSYIHKMSCQYHPWQQREIFCSTNYMEVITVEVSVERGAPDIDAQADQSHDWIDAFPDTITAASDIWQVVFHSPVKKNMTVDEAFQLGYGLNTTESRLLLRAPFQTAESETSVVAGIPTTSIRSTTFYRQSWMLLMVDTAVACPTDGTRVADQSLIWSVPLQYPALVAYPDSFKTISVTMGANGVLLDPETLSRSPYKLITNETHITIEVPVGAEGGYIQSEFQDGQYGMVYTIDLMLEHVWKDDAWDLSKHTVIHPVSLFFPLPPSVKNETDVEMETFVVTIGNFFPDAYLESVRIGTAEYPVEDLIKYGMLVKTTYPNRTISYTLTVSFQNPDVTEEVQKINMLAETKYLPTHLTTYILDVVFNFRVGPENNPYSKAVTVQFDLIDAGLPSSVGYCEENYLNLVIPNEKIGQLWVPYVNNLALNDDLASQLGIQEINNETHFWVKVPLSSAGAVYEVITLQGITAKFSITAKYRKTLATMGHFSVSCNFPLRDLIVCIPNGSIIVTASEDTLPITDLGKTTLKDENCTPVEYNETFAIFNFQLDSCGTTGRFEDNYVIYENEIHNKKKILRSDVAVITSDPLYRLTVLCKYRRNSTIQQYIPAYGSIVAPRLPSNGGPRAKRSRQILDIRVRLSRDMKYTHFYTDEEYPFEKNLKDPLFFEVALKQENTSVELSLETCWLSNSTGFDSKRKWSIYENGCEVQSTEYLTIAHPVSTAQVKRFEVLLFASADGTLKGPVYLHCMVMVCDARIYKGSSALCMKQCEMGHKLASYESRQYFNLQGYVSTGPVLLTQPTASAPERSITEQGNDSCSIWIWLIMGSAVVLFAIAAFKQSVNLNKTNSLYRSVSNA